MSARLTLLLALAALLAVPTVALGATKHGITPTSPKAGATIPVGKRPTIKGKVKGQGQVYVHVCKSKKKDKDGLICHDGGHPEGQEEERQVQRTSRSSSTSPSSGSTRRAPTTGRRTASRAIVGSDLSDCRQEGPIVKFKVG